MKDSSFIFGVPKGASPLFRFFLLFTFTAVNLLALSIDIQSGKEKGSTFSTIHISDSKAFICEPTLNVFKEVTKIECFFENAPVKPFSTVKNDFFTISSFETKKLFVLSVIPYKKIKLFDIKSDLAVKKRILQEGIRYATHWMIVGYKDTLPLIQVEEVPQNGLNFPIDFHNTMLPSIGALGLDDKPIELDQITDVSDYLEVRRNFERQLYDEVLNSIDKALEKDPNSIFKSEFLLYKIRTYMSRDELSEVIDLSKSFLRDYSANEMVPEVLLHIANASSRMGLVIDAEYFYDRLLNEHYDTKEATLGLIALGGHALAKGDKEKSIEYYRKALEKAESKDVASDAAFAISNYYISKGNVKEASFYIQKIATGNVDYLLSDYDRSFEIAKEFSDHEAYIEAADLMSELLKTFNKMDDRYEPLLYQISVWYDLGNSNEKAYELYKRYAKEFEYGEFLPEIEERMDKVLFEIGDTNTTKQLELYDTIATRYATEDIAQQARFNKAKLLVDLKKYQEVLNMKETLNTLDPVKYPIAQSFVLESAAALIRKELTAGSCENALLLLRGYDVNLTQDYSDTLYECSMKVSEYQKAGKIAERFIKEPDMTKRLKWLYRYVKSSSKIGDDKVVFVMGEDILNLASIENNNSMQDVMIDLFWASMHLKEENKALEWISKIEKTFGLRYADIELYVSMSKMANDKKDNTMLETYATKVVTLQEANKSYTFSPDIDYLLIEGLKKLHKDQKAYDQAKKLVTIVTKSKDKARAYYELGALSQRLGYTNDAKAAFKQSSQASETSSWSKLSKEALGLIE